MAKHYLIPKQPLDIEPAAERNVERMTECCLDVNGKSATIVKGRGGGAWWMIWMAVAFGASNIPFGIYIGRPLDGLLFFLLISGFFGISLYVWPVRVWRTHLPLRFCRKTRKVYFHFKGKTYIEDWDSIRAYLKIQGGLTGTGAPIRDAQVNIEFTKDDGTILTVFLMATGNITLTLAEKAAAFWEYIRRYMEDGPEKLPEPNLDIYRHLPYEELIKVHAPFPIIKTKIKWLWPIWIIVLFPLRTIWFLISYPTEVLYYYLEKRMKVDPFPPELEEPCRCD